MLTVVFSYQHILYAPGLYNDLPEGNSACYSVAGKTSAGMQVPTGTCKESRTARPGTDTAAAVAARTRVAAYATPNMQQQKLPLGKILRPHLLQPQPAFVNASTLSPVSCLMMQPSASQLVLPEARSTAAAPLRAAVPPQQMTPSAPALGLSTASADATGSAGWYLKARSSLLVLRSPGIAGETTHNQSTTQGQLSSLPPLKLVGHASAGAEAADRLPGAPLKEAAVIQEGCAAVAAVAGADTAARGSTGSFASAAASLEAAHNSKISRLGATGAVCGADGWGEVSEKGAWGGPQPAAVGLGNGLVGNLRSGQEDQSWISGLSASPFATGDEALAVFGEISLSVQKIMHEVLDCICPTTRSRNCIIDYLVTFTLVETLAPLLHCLMGPNNTSIAGGQLRCCRTIHPTCY